MTDDKTIQAAEPYTVEWSGENRTARVHGPGFTGPWKKEGAAVHQCADMNTAFRAGQASQQMPVDAERIGVGEYVVRFGSQQRGEQPNLMYEDELPNAMTTAEYDEWYKGSSVVDGVRMGPRFPSQPPSVSKEDVVKMLREAFHGYDRTGAGVSWERMKQVASEYGLSSLLNGQQRG